MGEIENMENLVLDAMRLAEITTHRTHPQGQHHALKKLASRYQADLAEFRSYGK